MSEPTANPTSDPKPYVPDYESVTRPLPRPRVHLSRWAWYAIIGSVLLSAALLACALRAGTELGNRPACGNNLSALESVLGMYAFEHQGHYPDTAADLMLQQRIPASVFICPSTSDTPATGATLQQIAANLSSGGHLSYIYLGAGQRSDDPNAVLFIEPLSNHAGKGAHAVLAGRRAIWLSAPQARQILDQVAAGMRPVRWPATQPSRR